MLATAHAEGALEGDFKAAFATSGTTLHHHIGDIFLFSNPDLRKDAVHELCHAACYYVRYYRRGDLSPSLSENGATEAEELLCEVMEHVVCSFSVELLKRERRMKRLLAQIPQ